MSLGFITVEESFHRAGKEILPPEVKFLDIDGRLFHVMPSADGTRFFDRYSAWIIERKYPTKKHFGSQILVSGEEIFDRQPTLEWARTKIAEALNRMVEFYDGGFLPSNGTL